LQNGGWDIHVYDSSVRHITSETGVDVERSTELIWKTDDSKFWVYPQAWRRLTEKWTPYIHEKLGVAFYIYATYSSFSIATEHDTALEQLDITIFVYFVTASREGTE